MKNCEFVWKSVEKFFFLVAIDDDRSSVVHGVVRLNGRSLSGEFGPKKGRKKCIYMYIYIGVYSVVACVEPTHDGVPNE